MTAVSREAAQTIAFRQYDILTEEHRRAPHLSPPMPTRELWMHLRVKNIMIHGALDSELALITVPVLDEKD